MMRILLTVGVVAFWALGLVPVYWFVPIWIMRFWYWVGVPSSFLDGAQPVIGFCVFVCLVMVSVTVLIEIWLEKPGGTK